MVTPCIRCGKTRIIAKTWKENATTYVQTVCPDPECQKMVEKELQKKNEKLALLQANSLKRRRSIQLGRSKNR